MATGKFWGSILTVLGWFITASPSFGIEIPFFDLKEWGAIIGFLLIFIGVLVVRYDAGHKRYPLG